MSFHCDWHSEALISDPLYCRCTVAGLGWSHGVSCSTAASPFFPFKSAVVRKVVRKSLRVSISCHNLILRWNPKSQPWAGAQASSTEELWGTQRPKQSKIVKPRGFIVGEHWIGAVLRRGMAYSLIRWIMPSWHFIHTCHTHGLVHAEPAEVSISCGLILQP